MAEMTWFLSEPSQEDVVKDLVDPAKQSDRAVAIIGAALIDQVLEKAIKSRLFLTQKKPMEALFDGGLQSFSTKIHLAYALGLFGEKAYGDLKIIRDLRNSFAHDLTADKSTALLTFSSPEVAQRCSELWLPQNIRRMGHTSTPTDPREQYLTAIHFLHAGIWGEMVRNKVQIPAPVSLVW